jgi:hypothetical protein
LVVGKWDSEARISEVVGRDIVPKWDDEALRQEVSSVRQ